MDFIHLPPSHGYRYVLDLYFPIRSKPSHVDKLHTSSVPNPMEGKTLSLPGELPLSSMETREPVLLVKYGKTVLFGQFYRIFANHPQSSGLVEPTASSKLNWQNLWKPTKTLAKTLPLVLLNLRSTPFETHKLSAFESPRVPDSFSPCLF